MRRTFLLALSLASVGGLGGVGCVRAPEIVVVDRATVLEEEAAGSFDQLEHDLDRAAFSPEPVPLTPDQLETLGLKPPPISNGAEQTDADRVDALLRQRCLGEGKDGLLVDTNNACKVSANPTLTVALLERTNQARAQLWQWMHARRPQTSLDTLRQNWTHAHRKGVVCGGWVQADDGAWAEKSC